MRSHLARLIGAAGPPFGFDRYMHEALYAPRLGYYVNGRRRFGDGGDFVTAPEISPLFGRCLGSQVAECLARLDGGSVLEVGAGSGRLAADLLDELARCDRLPERYLILEVSPDLRALQAETLGARVPGLVDRVTWLDALPDSPIDAVVVANELLDAMPVHRFRRRGDQWQECAVARDDDALYDDWRVPFSPGLVDALEAVWPGGPVPADGYTSEINLRLAPWLTAMAAALGRGYLLLIDYGYTAREYYHAERDRGTLICHFRHRAHADPYLLPGLQDITANVDFSAVARAAVQAGFVLAGYTTQAHFLIDNGLDRHLAAIATHDPGAQLDQLQAVKRLTLPAEMGERFKVIGLALGASEALSGFRTRDLRDRL